jgi:hypothetical protein
VVTGVGIDAAHHIVKVRQGATKTTTYFELQVVDIGSDTVSPSIVNLSTGTAALSWAVYEI